MIRKIATTNKMTGFYDAININRQAYSEAYEASRTIASGLACIL